MRINVYTRDFRRIVEQVIEGIAARAGDHHDYGPSADVENFVVESRVFPALVVVRFREWI